MERRDLAIALVGAALLVVATLGVGFTSVGSGSLAYEIVVYDGRDQTVPGTLGTTDASESEATREGTFDLDAPQIDRASLTVRASPTSAFVGGASLHVRLVAPNGTVYENEASAASGAGAFEVVVEVPGAPRPEGGLIEASSEEDARARLAQLLPPQVNGTWAIEASFASGGPVPPGEVRLTYVLEYSEWLADLIPAVVGR